jgi:hypothetical protein
VTLRSDVESGRAIFNFFSSSDCGRRGKNRRKFNLDLTIDIPGKIIFLGLGWTSIFLTVLLDDLVTVHRKHEMLEMLGVSKRP